MSRTYTVGVHSVSVLRSFYGCSTVVLWLFYGVSALWIMEWNHCYARI